MCFGPGTLGAGAKTHLESSIKKFEPHLIYVCMFFRPPDGGAQGEILWEVLWEILWEVLCEVLWAPRRRTFFIVGERPEKQLCIKMGFKLVYAGCHTPKAVTYHEPTVM